MSSSDSEEAGCSTDKTPPRKKTRISYKQAFKQEWMTDVDFKDWVKPDPKDKFSALCAICDCTLKSCNKTRLLSHKTSSKHAKNMASRKTATVIDKFVTKKKEPDLKDKVHKAELKLTAFMAEHDMPFSQTDHLLPLLKKMFPDSDIAQNMTLKKTKASYVMQDSIAWEESREIAKLCQENKFSLLIDESTDVSVSQNLAVVVRFFDRKKTKVTDALLDIVEVDDGSAHSLYQAVKRLLEEKSIPLRNIIGFASDNCSKMLGSISGFQALLKKDVPGVFILGCICHSFALCASHACAQLPSYLEQFLRDICCYFSRSSKRLHQFQLIQDIVHTPKHRMLKLSQTRWLSRGKVISRILEQWDALLLFFQAEMNTESVKLDGAADIYKKMNIRGTKHMLLFLNYTLGKVDKMNVEFQSEYFRLDSLYSTVASEYRGILGMFMKDEVLMTEKLANINPSHLSKFKALDNLHVGGRCEILLMKEPLQDDIKKRFLFDCRKFLVELCQQMRKRFTFEDESVLALLRALDPKVAQSPQRNVALAKLAYHFPMLVNEEDLDKLQDQWNDLLYAKEHLQNLTQNATSFWHELSKVKDGNNESKFGILSAFMCDLLALPHSSATVERVFSRVNMIKNKKTNRLHCATVANRLHAKQAIARQEVPCYEWEPSVVLINDLKSGLCHRRHLDRIKKTEEPTLHPGQPTSDESDIDEPHQVFVQ